MSAYIEKERFVEWLLNTPTIPHSAKAVIIVEIQSGIFDYSPND